MGKLADTQREVIRAVYYEKRPLGQGRGMKIASKESFGGSVALAHRDDQPAALEAASVLRQRAAEAPALARCLVLVSAMV